MATLLVRHRVNDYAAWRKVYDYFAPIQKRFGVTAEAVYQTDGGPNEVTVTHDFDSIAAARAFVESAELREAMGKAGVAGAPTIWFTNKGK